MKMVLPLIAILFVTSLLSGQTNRSEVATGTGFRQAAVEQELQALEQTWAQAVKQRDTAAINNIQAEEFEFTGPTGQIWTKARAQETIKTGQLQIDSFEMSEFKKFPPVSERWLPPISRRRAGGQAGAEFKQALTYIDAHLANLGKSGTKRGDDVVAALIDKANIQSQLKDFDGAAATLITTGRSICLFMPAMIQLAQNVGSAAGARAVTWRRRCRPGRPSRRSSFCRRGRRRRCLLPPRGRAARPSR